MIAWTKEARDLPPDKVTGAKITRLSGSALFTENMGYYDPRTTPDGRRFASWRFSDHLVNPFTSLLCHDIYTKLTCMLEREVIGHAIAPPWTGAVYYPVKDAVKKACLMELKTEVVFPLKDRPTLVQLMTVTADQKELYYTASIGEEKDRQYNIVRVKLSDGSWSFLFPQHRPDFFGVMHEPLRCEELITGELVWENGIRYGVGVVMDAQGRNPRRLYSHVHHACWMAGRREVAALKMFDVANIWHTKENPDGELTIYPTDGGKPRFIPTPEHLLYHISSSRCGKYLVGESLEGGLGGATPIVVVNVDTGKYRVLVTDCGCLGGGGGNYARQPKPYFTADSKHVIYTAEPDGITNVYAVELPGGFLEGLG